MQGDVPLFETEAVSSLGKDQMRTIAQVFGISWLSLASFRWGKSLAPKGHPKHGTGIGTLMAEI